MTSCPKIRQAEAGQAEASQYTTKALPWSRASLLWLPCLLHTHSHFPLSQVFLILKNVFLETREIAQELKGPPALPGDWRPVLITQDRQLTIACNFSSRASDSFFWPSETPAYTQLFNSSFVKVQPKKRPRKSLLVRTGVLKKRRTDRPHEHYLCEDLFQTSYCSKKKRMSFTFPLSCYSYLSSFITQKTPMNHPNKAILSWLYASGTPSMRT